MAGPGVRGPDHLHALPGLQPCSPTPPHCTTTPRNISAPGARHPPVPCKLARPPGTQDTSALRGEGQESWSTPTPTPTSLSGVPRRPNYPSRPPVGPIDASGQKRREMNGRCCRCACVSSQRELAFPKSSSWPLSAPYVAPSRGREETLRQRASGHRPSPPPSPATRATAASNASCTELSKSL